ncbi:MAG TPA: FAD-binding oxidoreductase [Cycloclasticus sp.]|jgi:glycine/D-amino acid oxidase-like deaminating enzyme|nr:FAD-binding oxidoreductase [Cycloclasticus sp.]HIL92159.1 FAD-binding oxidoreductase [Cycloclasticus sp.]
MIKKINILIVGQGLAGSLLGWRLLQAGHSVLIVDPGLKHTASRTAAGLINPITGKRLVKTEHVEEYLPAAIGLYQQLGEFFGETFWHAKRQVRLFQSDEECEQWKKRRSEAAYKPYLGDQFNADTKAYLHDSLKGGFEQKQCGYLDTNLLLDALKQYFQEKGCITQQHLNISDLTVNDLTIQWQNYTADKVVFCDGYQLQNNPWFSWLPLQPAQGEIFTLKTSKTLPEEIVQFGKWLLPLGNGMFRLGSTWQWKPIDEQISAKAEATLTVALEQQFPQYSDAKLIQKQVGVRPGTRDKMPFIGNHPHCSKLSVFNGFGSKGTLMIPWCSERFCELLTKGVMLPSFVDIKRYEGDCPVD